jgi:hypothetical protein
VNRRKIRWSSKNQKFKMKLQSHKRLRDEGVEELTLCTLISPMATVMLEMGNDTEENS